MFILLINNQVMVGAALAAGSTLISLFGAAMSGLNNNSVTKQIQTRRSDLDKWYTKEYNTNFLDTEQGKSTIQALKNQYGETMKKVSQNNAISGASDEAKVATGDRVQKDYTDKLLRLAGFSTTYKDAIRREYQGLKINLDNLDLQNKMQKGQNWTNLMNNAANATGGFLQADSEGAFKDWDGKLSTIFKK